MDIIDNVLPEKEFGGLQSYMMGDDCPWFYQEDGTLSHLFYSAKGQLPREDEEICAATAVILDPIMVKLGVIKPYKVEGYFKGGISNYDKDVKTVKDIGMVKDTYISGRSSINTNNDDKIAVFFVNTNDGYLEFEDGTKVPSIENSMVVFGSDVNYRAVEVNDSSRRVAINFIYQAQDFKVIKVKKD
jgi:hypothetical protein